MARINLVPLSVNRAWQGKRFKTKLYKDFEKNMLLLLPNINLDFTTKLSVEYTFGFSSKLSDLGNPEKLVTDILSKKYGFNDNQIYIMLLKKQIVAKGEEFIQFDIKKFE